MEADERKNRKRALKEEKKQIKAEKKLVKKEKKLAKKEENKNKVYSIKLVIILLVISIILLALTIFIFIKYNDEKELNKNYTENLSKQTKEYDKIKPDLDEIKAKEDELVNIDDSIAKAKEEVYKLTVDLEKAILEGKTTYKIAYITFDDGPYYLTHSVIDVLKEKRVKATFFTIGLNKDVCFDNGWADCSIMYKKIVDNGHTIANHTYSHLIFNGLYSSTYSFISSVEQQENMIKERTGYKTNIVRFPGGSATAGYLRDSIIGELRNRGYGWVDWTAQDGDGGSLSDTTTAWNNLYSTINENIEVVLFHDYNYTTYSILPGFIDWLESNNYIILPLIYDSVKVNK